MKKSLLFLIAFTLFLTGSLYSQTTINANTYRFNAANGSPVGILPTPLIGPNSDEVASDVTPIGFTFTFAGVPYTQFSVNENGLMTLGNTRILGSESTNLLGSATTNPKIAPYWDDLATGTTGSVSYYLSGTAPARVLYVNWNVTVPKNTIGAPNATFQVQLYENPLGTYPSQGNIIFAFPIGFPENIGGYSMGIGTSPTDFASVTVTGDTYATAAYGTAKDNNTMKPSTSTSWGKKFQFTTDNSAPTINANLAISIPNTAGTANRTLSTVVADQAGSVVSGIPVPPSGNVPRIYFKKNASGTWFSKAAELTAGTGVTGTWLFTVDHDLMGGVIGGDQIYYYVIAQDLGDYKGSPNIKSSPIGAIATSVNAVTTPPATAPYYTIPMSFSGIKTVGTGGHFASLTNTGGLFDQISTGELTGDLTINIISDLTVETGLNALNAWANGPGGPFTVTINPVGNRTVSGITVNGGNGGVITLNGATGVRIDGLNDGTNSLTFIQTGQYYVGSMIDIKGASNNTITRVTVKGYGASNAAITLTNSNAPSRPSSNNTVSYCNITSSVLIPNTNNAGNGITLVDWSGTTSTGNLNVIDHNTITNFVYNGIILSGKYTNTAVSNNDIYNTVGTSWNSNFRGINSGSVAAGTTNIFNNKVHDILIQSPGSGLIPGIVSSGGSGTTTNIYNNLIYLDASFIHSTQGWAGIQSTGLGAVNVYYNSIYIGGPGTTGTASSYGIKKDGTGTTNILNNVVVNARSNGTGTGKHYGIYAGTGAFNSNYNDIYTNGTGGYFGFSTTDRLTLTDWQTATGKDANSLSVDPQFTSVTDLLPLNVNLNAGTPITGITTDFTGSTRNTTTPTIGAYEMAHTTTTLNLNLFLEGLYIGSNTMSQAFDANGTHWPAGVADHITVELHDATNYATVVYSVTDVPLSTSGLVSITIPQDYNGNYYITIKHRNSVETTTPTVKYFAVNTVIHDFTTSDTMAYGNNLKNLNGVFAIYGGDVNQDGSIDTLDMIPIDNDSFNYAVGYLPSDVNGDGSVDTIDMITVDNNSAKYIGTQHP